MSLLFTFAWFDGLDDHVLIICIELIYLAKVIPQPACIRQVPVADDDYSTVFSQKSSRLPEKPGRNFQVAVYTAMKRGVTDDPVKVSSQMPEAVRREQGGF